MKIIEKFYSFKEDTELLVVSDDAELNYHVSEKQDYAPYLIVYEGTYAQCHQYCIKRVVDPVYNK